MNDYIEIPVPAPIHFRVPSLNEPISPDIDRHIKCLTAEIKRFNVVHAFDVMDVQISQNHPSRDFETLIFDAYFAIAEELYAKTEKRLAATHELDPMPIPENSIDFLKVWVRDYLKKSDLLWGWLEEVTQPVYKLVPITIQEFAEHHFYGVVPVKNIERI